ncbi:hypothetical protein Tamer19_72630 [Cupriavidus sp. TA19]|uniref:phage fiber-tail adaptor protein n=1 Tax=Cupriavidus sp. TA19 TaxID=701108 RepID=UPI00272944F1|nr:hypothetical protein [Cupriavidus sp. TA19]GLC97854.1 hypothetical protein Tamer19_72630 [Cupriavidus sp. TA19]
MSTIPAKDSDATLDYQVDWSAWLADGETIMADPAPVITVDDGLTLNPGGKSTSEAGGKVTFWLGAGTAGRTYTVACKITTSQGRVDQRSFRLPITQR